MVYDTGYNSQHKCAVFDFCILPDDKGTKILFCIFCKKVVGTQIGNDIKIMASVVTDKKKDEYSDELKESLV